MFDLTGKNALITGASGGIGGEIAKALHAAGATVALSGTRVEPLQALADEFGVSRRTVTRAKQAARAIDAGGPGSARNPQQEDHGHQRRAQHDAERRFSMPRHPARAEGQSAKLRPEGKSI